MPRIGNDSISRPIELPQEEPIVSSFSEGSSADVPELERPARSSSGAATQAAESAQAAQAQQKALQRQLLEKRADAIHDACSGIGTDEEKIFKNLSGLSPVEKKELDQIYKAKFGMSLQEQLKDELSGPELEVAMTLLNETSSTSRTQPQEPERSEELPVSE